jgi:SHS2 domain-containing protein
MQYRCTGGPQREITRFGIDYGISYSISGSKNYMQIRSDTSYFEHDADIGIVGRGTTLEQAFEAAAHAVFAIFTDLDKVQPNESLTLEFDESDPEFALVTWLNLLLGNARERGMVFSRFHIRHDGDQWQANALGEKWQPSFEEGVEVKGATLTMLSVRQIGKGWEARCIVDV